MTTPSRTEGSAPAVEAERESRTAERRQAAAVPGGLAKNVVAGICMPAIGFLGTYAIASFLYVALSRLFYPGEINFIEGVMMDHVLRLSRGEAIYVEPSLEFVPLAYMPGFTALGALLARAFGPALWELRLISFAGAL